MEYGQYYCNAPDTEGCGEDVDELEMKEAEEKRTWGNTRKKRCGNHKGIPGFCLDMTLVSQTGLRKAEEGPCPVMQTDSLSGSWFPFHAYGITAWS